MDYNEEDLQLIHDGYGKPTSVLFKEIQTAGFKPIGITVMMCEETFIFKGSDEAERAAKMFLPEGWWYDFSSWIDARKVYVKESYRGIDDDAPIVYWLDHNFAPKINKL